MQDIPFFTTKNGAAGLVLKEIPVRKRGYIKIHSSSAPKDFLDECIEFCCMAGAETIYACGHPYLENLPCHATIIEMRCDADSLLATECKLFPLQENTLEQWRQIYNDRMKEIPNAAWMSLAEGQKLCKNGGGYFVHRNGELVGIGIAKAERIDNVISVIPGMGKDVVCALSTALSEQPAVLEVAAENSRAVKLYEKLGFIATRELSRWYKVF